MELVEAESTDAASAGGGGGAVKWSHSWKCSPSKATKSRDVTRGGASDHSGVPSSNKAYESAAGGENCAPERKGLSAGDSHRMTQTFSPTELVS